MEDTLIAALRILMSPDLRKKLTNGLKEAVERGVQNGIDDDNATLDKARQMADERRLNHAAGQQHKAT